MGKPNIKYKRYFLIFELIFSLLVSMNVSSSQVNNFDLDENLTLVYQYEVQEEKQYIKYRNITVNETSIYTIMETFFWNNQSIVSTQENLTNLIYSQEFIKNLSQIEIVKLNYGGKSLNCVNLFQNSGNFAQIVDIDTGIVCEEEILDDKNSFHLKLISWENLDLNQLYNSYHSHNFWGYFISILGFIFLVGILFLEYILTKMNGYH